MTDNYCWPLIEKDYRSPAIVSGFSLYSHLSADWHSFENILIDTGYDGDLLLEYDLYRQLGFHLFEISDSLLTKAELIDGSTIELQNAITKIKWGKREFEILIESVTENNETLIGRGLFIKYSSVYCKKKHLFCLKDDIEVE